MKHCKSVVGLIPLIIILVALCFPGIAVAQDEEDGTPTVSLSTEFPKIEGKATDSFTFNVELEYTSNSTIEFDLTPTAPNGWTVYVTPQYESTRISSISVDASVFGTTKNIKLVATPPTYPYAAPGEYTLSLEASSDDISDKLEVSAVIIPRGVLNAAPANESGLYSTRVVSGKDNIYSIQVANTGTSIVNNVSFTTSDKPDEWEVTFSPEKIDSLDVLSPVTVDVHIKPPSSTTSGDYMMTLRVNGEDVTNPVDMDIRVTVQTSTIWGWVGVAIIIIVIAGLLVIFMRFGRR